MSKLIYISYCQDAVTLHSKDRVQDELFRVFSVCYIARITKILICLS